MTLFSFDSCRLVFRQEIWVVFTVEHPFLWSANTTSKVVLTNLILYYLLYFLFSLNICFQLINRYGVFECFIDSFFAPTIFLVDSVIFSISIFSPIFIQVTKFVFVPILVRVAKFVLAPMLDIIVVGSLLRCVIFSIIFNFFIGCYFFIFNFILICICCCFNWYLLPSSVPENS